MTPTIKALEWDLAFWSDMVNTIRSRQKEMKLKLLDRVKGLIDNPSDQTALANVKELMDATVKSFAEDNEHLILVKKKIADTKRALNKAYKEKKA